MSVTRLVPLLLLLPLRPRQRPPLACGSHHACVCPLPPIRTSTSRSRTPSQIPSTTPSASAEPYDPIAFSQLAKELSVKMKNLPRFRADLSATNWSREDDIKLCQLVHRGQTFAEIAPQMDRSFRSVMFRYDRLCQSAKEVADLAAATTTTTTRESSGPESPSTEKPTITLPGTDIPMVMERQQRKKKKKEKSRTGSSRWTAEEDAILRKMRAAGRTMQDIVAHLPNRKEKGIRARCSRLRLTRRKRAAN
ncbi:hypothetical protein BDZ88DRAFT_405084 [Geranomyces variabilis]|nr:hypothetical protein BDZ88DRAFT_405084 [Geranomyces variabilis]KAJ3138652.1 hypothetical protein HDU90_001095 [Geranomyces variabilis]